MAKSTKEIEEMAEIADNVSGCRGLGNDIATALDKAGYRKQSETVKELFAKCVVIQTISNPQKEDMDSEEAYTIIEQLAEQYDKEEK